MEVCISARDLDASSRKACKRIMARDKREIKVFHKRARNLEHRRVDLKVLRTSISVSTNYFALMYSQDLGACTSWAP